MKCFLARKRITYIIILIVVVVVIVHIHEMKTNSTTSQNIVTLFGVRFKLGKRSDHSIHRPKRKKNRRNDEANWNLLMSIRHRLSRSIGSAVVNIPLCAARHVERPKCDIKLVFRFLFTDSQVIKFWFQRKSINDQMQGIRSSISKFSGQQCKRGVNKIGDHLLKCSLPVKKNGYFTEFPGCF